jgi:hypothetical protein
LAARFVATTCAVVSGGAHAETTPSSLTNRNGATIGVAPGDTAILKSLVPLNVMPVGVPGSVPFADGIVTISPCLMPLPS